MRATARSGCPAAASTRDSTPALATSSASVSSRGMSSCDSAPSTSPRCSSARLMPTRDSVLAMLCSSAQASIPVWNSRCARSPSPRWAASAPATAAGMATRPGSPSASVNVATSAWRASASSTRPRQPRARAAGAIDCTSPHWSPISWKSRRASCDRSIATVGRPRPHRDVGEEDAHHAVRPAVR